MRLTIDEFNLYLVQKLSRGEVISIQILVCLPKPHKTPLCERRRLFGGVQNQSPRLLTKIHL